MDIKTLPTILCYVSSATTLNTYSHITDEMQQLAAEKIDRDTAKAEVKQPEDFFCLWANLWSRNILRKYKRRFMLKMRLFER